MSGKIIFFACLALAQAGPGLTRTRYVADDRCPADMSHYLLPHEWDCTKFYYCEYGLRWEDPTDCAPGTEFSYNLQVCTHPAQANCNLPNVPPTEAPTTTQAPTTTTTKAPETTTTTTQAPTTTTTTQAPTTTTTTIQAPTTTTTTTQAPTTTTTKAPETTTTTTQAPTTTTTTQASTTTTTTTQAPTTTTTTTQAPTTTTTTTQAPTTTTTTTQAPTTTTTQAPTTTTTTQAPNTTTTQAPTTTTTTTTQAPTTNVTTTTAAPTTEANQGVLPNGCPSDFGVHQLLPNKKNCSKFYYCNFGELVERDCPEGTLFNPDIQVCDWPYNVDCQASNANNTTTQAPTTTEASNNTTTQAPATTEAAYNTTTQAPATTEASNNTTTQAPTTTAAPNNTTTEAANNTSTEGPSSTTEANQGVLPNGCPSDFSVHQLLPKEDDCSKFYFCNFGELVERDCPEETLFNPEIQVCDWPYNVDCQASSANNTTTQAPNNTTTQAPTTTESANNTTTQAPATTESAYNTTTQATTEAANNTTTQAPATTEAANNTTTPAPATTETPNNTTQTPNVPNNTTTQAPTTEAPGSGDLANGCPSNFSEFRLLPHEKYCNKFYICNFGELVETKCAEGTVFNPVIQVCDYPENVNCTDKEPETDGGDQGQGVLPNGCPSDFSVHQLLPNDKDCSKFYQCNFGDLVAKDCPAGLLFNPEIQVCDWPENVQCSGSGSGSGDGNDEKCKDSCNVAPWAADTCNSYWRCEGDEAVKVTCSHGLQFNANSGTCDYSDNVDCA